MNSKQLRFARKTKKILTLVEQDLKTIWRSSSGSNKPLVTVDWSELLAYAYAMTPHLATVPPLWRRELPSLHYSALAYLFHRLPCQLLLLPPYVWEMRTYLQRIKHEAKAVKATLKDNAVISKLVAEFRELEKKNPQFKRLLQMELDQLTIDDQLKNVLREIVQCHLPDIYLNIQSATLEALEALRSVIYGEKQKRVITLQDLDPALLRKSEPALRQWHYWHYYMENERKNAPARNKIDAIALSYLEILHQHLFWENRTLLFATRSPTMFRIMGYHPGVFQYPIEMYSEDVEYPYSSARSWEYFAEIGYYLSKGRSKEDLDKLSRRKQWITLRMKNLEDLKPEEISDFDKSLSSIEIDWGNIRGTFNLQGLGDQKHWNRLQDQDDILLMQVIRALLSNKLEHFVQEKEDIANKILDKIQEIMDSGLRESIPNIHGKSVHAQVSILSSTSLLEHLLTVIDYKAVFQNHFVGQNRAQLVELFRTYL